jgi:hypothetical protein
MHVSVVDCTLDPGGGSGSRSLGPRDVHKHVASSPRHVQPTHLEILSNFKDQNCVYESLHDCDPRRIGIYIAASSGIGV